MTSHSPVVIEAFQKMMDRYSEGGGVADLGNDRNMTHLASVLTYVEAEALARGRMEGAEVLQEAKELIELLVQNDDLVPIWKRAVQFLEKEL